MDRYHLASKILSKTYNDFAHYNRKNPLEELVFIICSSKTDEEKYRSIFNALRRAYPTFQALMDAPGPDIARILEPAGLSNQKANIIKDVLMIVNARFGRPTLAPLNHMTDDEAEEFLLSLPRIGKKTTRCVLMYSLGREVFPVDTHCWRIAIRLGWIKPIYADGRCTQSDMDRLQDIIPRDVRHSLHVNLISHGRKVCTARSPKCRECPLLELCPRIGVGED